jgi:thiaminase/transcriptional activator TenA
MKFSRQLKKTAEPVFEAQLEHPFVKGLGDGKLSLDRFQYYMIQDTLYIVEYARALAWVTPLMPDVKNILGMLDAAKETFRIEFMLKEQYFKEFGLTTEDALKAELAPTCKAYIDHLFRYTRTGTLAEGMAAVLPCGWIYVEIGQVLASGEEIPDDHPYKTWLMTYAVPELRDMIDWWFDILDQAVEGYPEPTLAHISDIFLKSCRYEWLFWDMAWNKEEWRPSD